MEGFTRLVACEYFAVDRLQLQTGSANLGFGGKLQILIALDDACSLLTGTSAPIPLPRAKAVVVPASAAPSSLHCDPGSQIIRILQP